VLRTLLSLIAIALLCMATGGLMYISGYPQDRWVPVVGQEFVAEAIDSFQGPQNKNPRCNEHIERNRRFFIRCDVFKMMDPVTHKTTHVSVVVRVFLSRKEAEDVQNSLWTYIRNIDASKTTHPRTNQTDRPTLGRSSFL